MTKGDEGTAAEYFQYEPSLALGLIGLLFFTFITVVIALQTLKHRVKFMWIVVFTGGLEVAGYISHLIAAETYDDSAFTAYLVFTILAPNFLALANYICVGKVAQELQLSGRFLNAKFIATAFFIVDLICIGIQGGGSAILSSALDTDDDSKTSNGQTVVLIGLAIQLFFFASFSFVAAYVYHLQQTKSEKSVPAQVYICLGVTIALITLRNIYRVIEMAVS